jgi:hypothetical protein
MTRINVIYIQRADCVNGLTSKCQIQKRIHVFRKVEQGSISGNNE